MAANNPQRLLCVLVTIAALSSPGNTTEANEEPPVVVTKYGKLEGKKVSVKGTAKPVYNYLGIPFAKPPIGPLRFTAPQAAEAWTGTREATSQPPGCLQDGAAAEALKELIAFDFVPSKSSEDCLYLNVYTPVGPKDKNKRLPVMVWIHGGGFVIGSASLYDGTSLAAYEDVVVVAIQYRLGMLGFLSTGDEHLPGNWGMFDQVAALKWVQENIENFGGDPGLVTIFGESAGAFSVSFHLVSPLSSGLFHRAISESGTALIKLGMHPDPKSMALIIANASGCDTDDSREIVDCLKKLSEEELLNITKPPQAILSVVVDGVFLRGEVGQLLEAKEVNSVPYLLGVNNQECGWMLAKMLNPPGWEEGMDRETVESMLRNMSLMSEDFLKLTIDEYMGDVQDKARIRDLHLELMGDVFMLVPTVQFARFHRDAGNAVFLYEFQHRPSVYGNSRPDFVMSDHSDELGFVFGAPFWNNDIKLLGNATEEELALSRTVMSYWANFARKGDPNGEGLVLWPRYDHNEGYMQLDLKQEAGRKLKEHRVKFHAELQKQQSSKKRVNHLHPVVRIEDGFLRGEQQEVEGTPRAVFGYIGIPFAAPPVGPLRFAPPKKPQPWTGILNVTSHPPMCLQKLRKRLEPFPVPASEDCLYLSVYTPVRPSQQNISLPVMVWIHGGAFILGKSSSFSGAALAGFGNVVVVIIQYRISVAGFLSTGDEYARGNFGFLDQLAALQWVQKNIREFGGNQGMVTLFGQSVGSLSVSLHMLSPLSTGLFHQAILESGSSLMPGLVPPVPTQLADEVAQIAGCNCTQSQLLLRCLSIKSKEEMAEITVRLNELYQLIPALIVDGYFLPDNPWKMFQNRQFQQIPILVGVTTEELIGSLVHPEKIILSNWEAGINREQIQEKINQFIKPLFGEENAGLIFDEYFEDVNDSDTLKDRYLDLFGDVFITIPTLRAAQFYKGDMTEGEKNLSKLMMSYWASFAWNRNPNRNDLPVWPMNNDSGKYMQFNLALQIGNNLKNDKLKFWSNKPPKIIAKILV
ncbi:fatty acyl-CoA hydrolase precursor, medium chain isoform X1 [Stegostoma tigrinum]|uniref:fatty acyl-CoA hydrolase precursor, medium chain isoform X1 n=1 Tax=Stegostoma tigrinum TaxID=3053191 RepID=UPI00286FCDD3|nr:fatty acyl-CoA hydrolase precursor, medium chain isoform X1 [Stegostoma tigrinum]